MTKGVLSTSDNPVSVNLAARGDARRRPVPICGRRGLGRLEAREGQPRRGRPAKPGAAADVDRARGCYLSGWGYLLATSMGRCPYSVAGSCGVVRQAPRTRSPRLP